MRPTAKALVLGAASSRRPSPPGGKWTGPPIAHGMDRLVLTAHYVFAPIVTGCTSEQLHSAMGVACSKLDDQDTQAGHQYDHVLRCTGGMIECCIRSNSGNYGQCDAAVPYPRTPNPPTAAVVCETLKAEKGVWTPDPKSIKQNSDKKHCAQAFTCASPPADKLERMTVFGHSRSLLAASNFLNVWPR